MTTLPASEMLARLASEQAAAPVSLAFHVATALASRREATVKERGPTGRWCVPSAIAMLTGCSYATAESVLRGHMSRERAARPMKGCYPHEFIPALEKLGAQPVERVRGRTVSSVVSQWGTLGGVLVVTTRNHIFLSFGGARFDNIVAGRPITGMRGGYGRRRVERAWLMPAARVLAGGLS